MPTAEKGVKSFLGMASLVTTGSSYRFQNYAIPVQTAEDMS
jgi:hypothetical protein